MAVFQLLHEHHDFFLAPNIHPAAMISGGFKRSPRCPPERGDMDPHLPRGFLISVSKDRGTQVDLSQANNHPPIRT